LGALPAFQGVLVRFLRVGRSAPTVAAAVVLGAMCAGCQPSPTAPGNYQAFTITDLVMGTGTEAASGNVLTVYYTGWVYDASKVDQKGPVFSSTLGTNSYSFTLGAGTVIQGWEQGLVGMQVGGKRRLVVPPSMAYGGMRASSIPPNCTLLFEIDLLDVE
jgi:FKBP-type peptidyl-prolyl cis-trans isomerase FkpA